MLRILGRVVIIFLFAGLVVGGPYAYSRTSLAQSQTSAMQQSNRQRNVSNAQTTTQDQGAGQPEGGPGEERHAASLGRGLGEALSNLVIVALIVGVTYNGQRWWQRRWSLAAHNEDVASG